MNLLLWRNYGVNSQVHLFHRYNIFLYIFKLKKNVWQTMDRSILAYDMFWNSTLYTRVIRNT